MLSLVAGAATFLSFSVLTLQPATAAAAAVATSQPSEDCCFEPSNAYNKKMVDNYLSVWEGNYDLTDSTFGPIVDFYTDRFPSPYGFGNGSTPKAVHTLKEYIDFVKLSRAGWDEYHFEVLRWAGNENEIAVRWRLDAVMGANFTTLPTTLEQGDFRAWNGTDFLVLDDCTGLIKEVDSSEDLITFMYSLGIDTLSI